MCDVRAAGSGRRGSRDGEQGADGAGGSGPSSSGRRDSGGSDEWSDSESLEDSDDSDEDDDDDDDDDVDDDDDADDDDDDDRASDSEEGGGAGGTWHHAWPQSHDHEPSHLYVQCRDGARRVFTDQADVACTKLCEAKHEVFGESPEGGEVHPTIRTACEADSHMDDSFNQLTLFPVWPQGGGDRHTTTIEALAGSPLEMSSMYSMDA